jgi:hypothetical protein
MQTNILNLVSELRMVKHNFNNFVTADFIVQPHDDKCGRISLTIPREQLAGFGEVGKKYQIIIIEHE